MRTLAEMSTMVSALAHDRTQKTYVAAMVAARLRDAFRDLVDRMLADPLAIRCLRKVGEETAVADRLTLPADCARLLRVELWNETDEEWFPLPNDQQGAMGGVAPLPRSATFEILGSSYAGASPRTWRADADGAAILLWPLEATGTVRLVYIRLPAWPAGSAGLMDLPEGADELVEYLAADKLIAMEPQDQRRLQTYASFFSARYQTWREGVTRGRIEQTQRYVAEVGE